MKTFYFNTGVRPESGAKLQDGQVWLNGTKQIPFDCKDVPEDSTFLCACDKENLYTQENVIMREIYNSTIISKFAYFRLRV